MKTTFELNGRQVKIVSLHLGQLYGDLMITTKVNFNEFTQTAVQRFTDRIVKSQIWQILTPAPIAGDDKKFIYRDYSEIIVIAASILTTDIEYVANVVWIQEADTEINPAETLKLFDIHYEKNEF